MPTVASIKALLQSMPTAIRGVRTGKMRSIPKRSPASTTSSRATQDHVKRIYETGEESREELNLYIVGEGGEEEQVPETEVAGRRPSRT